MKTLHLICNAHIDPIWQWTEEEGISAVLSTFRSAANLLDEYDYITRRSFTVLWRRMTPNSSNGFKKR